MSHASDGIDLEASVGYLLKEAATALRLAMEQVLRPLDLTVTRYSCLELLSQRPGLSNSDLARGAFVTRQSMNVLLRAMEADGEVVRPDQASIGKVLPARLTPAGAATLAAASAAVRGVEERMLSGLDDVDEARRMLRAMIGALSDPEPDPA
ncbi:MarR family winged helix-turn-helix transcriptional regulator [Rhodococcoides corynebacterioides]|uniref:MarR family transcriptional regulator n=1 Tax=Rhodococcoides corynebacterioides TaxID=53972 RepID=A0ABS7P6R5_9NOCA|nr:MarR family transcriptional regulator [Rhodococcus corynebacterioides]MBY6367721.1 MarR family transcriptional regulator [Rhodococcus corynebacterioides]MBY6408520.1 MarR family transcriptional regulator [Rhodococcus corynebacterioides]